jgi:hypothetical protein
MAEQLLNGLEIAAGGEGESRNCGAARAEWQSQAVPTSARRRATSRIECLELRQTRAIEFCKSALGSSRLVAKQERQHSKHYAAGFS